MTARVLVAALGVTLVAAGCGSSGPSTTGGSSARTLRVVASTNVYADVVSQIAGDAAQVTAIVDRPDADPHSFEADPRNQLAVSRADVVVENGGGYDDFMDTLLRASHDDAATVLNVVAISGKTAAPGGELNEHVWYDFPTMAKLAAALVDTLSRLDPAGASTFAANAATFTAGLDRLDAAVAKIRSAHAGTGVAVTEPVPLYLLRHAGLVNRTPAAFSEAIEEGTGVPAKVLHQTTDLFAHHRVALLVSNAQTTGPETTRVVAAAKHAGVPVVPVTETLPDGTDYLGWMRANVAAIARALG